MCKLEKTENTDMVKELSVAYHFPCPIYQIERPDFLKSVLMTSDELLEKIRKENKINEFYPVYMSDNFYEDVRVKDFAEFVGGTAWNILSEQGYDMQHFKMFFTEMWTQEHHKFSSMEQHVHGGGAQIVGFYFLEVPENAPPAVFYDPRTCKTMIDLPEENPKNPTVASRMINFTPKEGLLIFTNAWLGHSFGKNTSDKPFKFVHFNLVAQPVIQQNNPVQVEII
jgi:uncharacterized protein (TIGR02466 family)